MENQEQRNQEFYTISEIAKLLGISPGTIRKWLKDQELKYYIFAGKYRINKNDLKEFLESHKNG